MNRYSSVGELGLFIPLGLQLEQPSEDTSVQCCTLVCTRLVQWSAAPAEDGVFVLYTIPLISRQSSHSAAHAHMGLAQDWSCEDRVTVSAKSALPGAPSKQPKIHMRNSLN